MHIYKFTHIKTGRSYIGQTVQNPNRRRLEHISGSRHSKKTYHFHNALKKYGIDAFTFEVITNASSLEELNILEEQYVDQFDAINNGFNIRQPGNNKLHSVESKERMSAAQKAAHARRRELGIDTWKRKDGGPMKGKVSPKKGKESTKWAEEDKQRHKIRMKQNDKCSGKTWKVIDGKRVWLIREAVV